MVTASRNRRGQEPKFQSVDSLGIDEALTPFDRCDVTDVIEAAKSGRANCRGCGRNIGRGEWRFGEALPNAYGEGDSLFWFHLECAACMRSEKFGPALDAWDQAIQDREWMQKVIGSGLEHPRLQRLLRAERSPSSAAHCRQCREIIPKGSWRLVLQMFEEGRMQPVGFIHVQCAQAYFETADILDRVARLTEGLGPNELAEIQQLSRTPQPAVSAP